MLLTITATDSRGASGLSYLLHKHPARIHEAGLASGMARVFYPETSDTRSTAAVQLEIAPAEQASGMDDGPYAGVALLSVALRRLFGAAMAGRCSEMPDLVDTPLPLEMTVSVIQAGGPIERLFQPLGYQVDATPIGGTAGRYVELRLSHQICVRDALLHLYTLLPALDPERSRRMSRADLEHVARHRKQVLAGHPEREWIERLYKSPKPARPDRFTDLEPVLALIRKTGARRVLDLGCGSGTLLARLAADPHFTDLAGVEFTVEKWNRAVAHLRRQERVPLWLGSLVYPDSRLRGYDLITVLNGLEDPCLRQLTRLTGVLFRHARPRHILMAPPLPSQADFEAWAKETASAYGYQLQVETVQPAEGSRAAMAVFRHAD